MFHEESRKLARARKAALPVTTKPEFKSKEKVRGKPRPLTRVRYDSWLHRQRRSANWATLDNHERLKKSIKYLFKNRLHAVTNLKVDDWLLDALRDNNASDGAVRLLVEKLAVYLHKSEGALRFILYSADAPATSKVKKLAKRKKRAASPCTRYNCWLSRQRKQSSWVKIEPISRLKRSFEYLFKNKVGAAKLLKIDLQVVVDLANKESIPNPSALVDSLAAYLGKPEEMTRDIIYKG